MTSLLLASAAAQANPYANISPPEPTEPATEPTEPEPVEERRPAYTLQPRQSVPVLDRQGGSVGGELRGQYGSSTDDLNNKDNQVQNSGLYEVGIVIGGQLRRVRIRETVLGPTQSKGQRGEVSGECGLAIGGFTRKFKNKYDDTNTNTQIDIRPHCLFNGSLGFGTAKMNRGGFRIDGTGKLKLEGHIRPESGKGTFAQSDPKLREFHINGGVGTLVGYEFIGDHLAVVTGATGELLGEMKPSAQEATQRFSPDPTLGGSFRLDYNNAKKADLLEVEFVMRHHILSRQNLEATTRIGIQKDERLYYFFVSGRGNARAASDKLQKDFSPSSIPDLQIVGGVGIMHRELAGRGR